METNDTIRQWASCLEDLTRRHYYTPVSIEVIGPDIGAQVEVKHLPLQGLSLDIKDRPQGAVSIVVGAQGTAHVERLVHQPVDVSLKRDADGHDEALAIESADGTLTLVRFEGSWPD